MIIKGTRVTTAPTAIFLANTLKSAIRIDHSATAQGGKYSGGSIYRPDVNWLEVG